MKQLIRSIVAARSPEFISKIQLVNTLDDYNAFNSNKTLKIVLRTIIKNGFARQLLDFNPNNEKLFLFQLNTLNDKICHSTGLDRDLVNFATALLSFAITSLPWTTLNNCQKENYEKPITEILTNQVINLGNGVQFTMIAVAGGDFNMGATPEHNLYAFLDEKPASPKSVVSFRMMQTPVTQRLWRAVTGEKPSKNDNPDCPVECVNMEDIKDFISLLNAKTHHSFRLPTETEWEYAARGGNHSHHYRYAGTTDNINDYAWNKNNSGGTTHPVATLLPNELGLYDMSGNVWEWTADNYVNSLSLLPYSDPQSTWMSVRGGSFDDPPRCCRVAKRQSFQNNLRNQLVGFRLAESI